MKHQTIALILIFSLSALAVQAQQVFNSKEDKNTSTYHIKALKDGILLVRLPSNRKKIEALENTLKQKLSDKEHKNVSKSLSNTISDTENLHAEIISAMGSVYKFSEHAFFLDYDTREVIQGNGKLYQSDMNSLFELGTTASVYVLSIGRTAENSINSFIVQDNELQNIPRPFPGTISRSGLAGLFGNDTSHIKKLNKKLWRYYNSLTE